MPIITDLTNPNKKQVCHMDEIQKRKVVQHNDLISSVAKMDKRLLLVEDTNTTVMVYM